MSINRFQVWFDEPESLPLLLYAPQGTGKTTLLKEFCGQLKEKYGNTVIYYEFRGGHLITEQNVNNCLLLCMRNTFPQSLLRGDEEQLDAFTIFERLVEIFNKLDNLDSLEKRILFIVDCPERCEVSSCASLWEIICNRWNRRISSNKIKLIVTTTVEEALEFQEMEVIRYTGPEVKNMDIDHQRQPHHEFLKEQANGCILLYKMLIYCQEFELTLPKTLYEGFDLLYRPQFAPFLILREDSSESFLISESRKELLSSLEQHEKEEDKNRILKVFNDVFQNNNSSLDWFALQDEEYRRAHILLAKLFLKNHTDRFANTHGFFHAMKTGIAELYRPWFTQLGNIQRACEANFQQFLLDLGTYCVNYPNDITSRVIKNCCIQSKLALEKDPRQVTFQFLARIPGVASDLRGDVEISNLLNECRYFRSDLYSWLQPVRASMKLVPETTLQVISAHDDSILGISLVRYQNQFLAMTASYDASVKLFNIITGRCEMTICHEKEKDGYCSCVSFIANNQTSLRALVGMSNGSCRLYSIENAKGYYQYTLISVLNGHLNHITACHFQPNLSSVMITTSTDSTCKLWIESDKTSEVEVRRTYAGHEKTVLCAQFVPDKYDLIVTGGADETIRVWSKEKETCISIFYAHLANVTSLAFRSDGLFFASGGWDCRVKVWSIADVLNQQMVDPSTLVQTSDSTCTLTHRSWVWGVVFISRDILATSSENGLIHLWNLNIGKCVLSFDAHFGLGVYCIDSLFSTNYLVSAGIDSTLRVFDVSEARWTTTRQTITMAEPWNDISSKNRFQNEITCASFPTYTFSEEKNRILCFLGSKDKSIRSFDLETGRCVKKMETTLTSLSELKISFTEKQLLLLSDSKEEKEQIWDRFNLQQKQESTLPFGCHCMVDYIWKRVNWYSTSKVILSESNEFQLFSGEHRKPYIPCTFDKDSKGIKAWSPSIEEDENLVFVVTENNGLVHVLHSII